MFDVYIEHDNICISSVETDDFNKIENWVKNIRERFLEYYVSECELLLKISLDNNLVGIVKGRLEFRNPNEIWIQHLLINHSNENEMFDSVINMIIKHFSQSYGIKDFYSMVIENDKKSIDRYKKNNFFIERISKNFFNIQGELYDMVILRLRV